MPPHHFKPEPMTDRPTDANCHFCKIIQGEMECHSVYEDSEVLTFLDDRPLFPGHCLIVPKGHYPTLIDLPANWLEPVFRIAQRVAMALETVMLADGSFVAINNHVSQSVPHLHVHVVPRHRQDGLKGFFWPRHPYRDQAHILSVQTSLRQALTSVGE
ncbi:MAG: HIT family protein [Terriglobia bacterium]